MKRELASTYTSFVGIEMMVPKWFIFGLICLMTGCTGGNEMCKAAIGRRGACPPTWIKWGGKCYKAIMKKMTWFEAKDECVKMGSVLVVPQSDEETELLLRLMAPRFWINCDDLQEEGNWICHDGIDEVDYRNWDALSHQPDKYQGLNERCAEVYFPSGKWNDFTCDENLTAICKGQTSLYHRCASRLFQ
ncbi:hepatic lectin-like [Acanthaster planci]|uniref:Hepatic lectin-like n=1 Tax=Acanthaster planci TaxID=133434 RepID=A0A8B7YRY4_ACAPL|nr:hepatic lectin-like [Acanthaster planci]